MIRTIARYGVRSMPGDEQAVIEAFRRGEAVHGPAITDYERHFAEYQGAAYATATSYGRMAFYYILRALDLEPGSEVIFPALTFWVIPEIALRTGLKPVFVDVDPLTFNIDPEKIEERVTTRTRAIVPTHLYGQPCDMNAILPIAEKHNLIVIEDCAQAAGARYQGRLVGTFGTASLFSFQMLKGINTYGGGMAITNDALIGARVCELASREPHQSRGELLKRFGTGFVARALVSPKGFAFWGFPMQAIASLFGHYDLSRFVWEKIRSLQPFPESYHRRYSNAQAILGLRALASLDKFNARSRAHALTLTRGLADSRSVLTPKVIDGAEHVYYQYCVYISDPERAGRRAIRRGVDFETTHVDVCSTMPLFKEFAAHCPGAEETARALQLPVYSRLRDSDVERVLRVVREVTHDLRPLDNKVPGNSSEIIARSQPA